MKSMKLKNYNMAVAQIFWALLVLMFAFLTGGLIYIYISSYNKILGVFLACLGGYVYYKSSNFTQIKPSSVTLSDESITFKQILRKKSFTWKKIDSIHVLVDEPIKAIPTPGKLFFLKYLFKIIPLKHLLLVIKIGESEEYQIKINEEAIESITNLLDEAGMERLLPIEVFR